jgi:hypothetical protein
MARWTRLELATPAVTGRYSNQLNYHRTNMVTRVGFEPEKREEKANCFAFLASQADSMYVHAPEDGVSAGSLRISTFDQQKISGDPCWIRTNGPFLKRELLYQLS